MISRRQALTAPLLAALPLAVPAAARAAAPFRVAYAGSMGALMDKGIGPAFASAAHVQVQGIGQGAFALARLIAAKQLRADVFIPITAGPFEVVRKAGLGPHAVPVASTQMCIAYSPKSRFAKDFEAAAAGRLPWYEVLLKPGLRFGRTDPRTDPQGRNILFALRLAELYYRKPGLAHRLLGETLNPRQIFTETSLLARLDAGQIDASSGYLSAVKSQRLPFILLPKEINLGDPTQAKAWYDRAKITVPGPHGTHKTVSPQPLEFYAVALDNAADPAMARRFVHFLRSAEGQKLFASYGYSPPGGPVLGA
ncbi:MAG: substrate-binding domain-containing protein [Rhodospirillales bacterium]|nr:substrate-binding domain-containing protein [Rhodospirillales bacterium]